MYARSDSPPLSEWYLAHAKILSKQTLKLGGQDLTCLHVVSSTDARTLLINPSFVEIVCSSEQNDFTAFFSGQPSDSSAFYGLLHSATE